jgi:single-strand DNA-binding protein
MAAFNKVLLIGNLTRDPELRYTPQGTAVVNLRIAVNRRFKDKTGEQKEEVCFLTVVVWDKQAEVCNQYLQKGRQVFIEGRLQSRSWEDNSGQRRSVLEVRAERVQFLGPASAAQRTTRQPDTANLPTEDDLATKEILLEESEERQP